jgi:chromosome segregation ATPase
MMKMEKKREYTHEDMEALGKEIEVLRIRARPVDQDIRNGVISHEQWVSAAQELMERKKEIMEILVDVDRDKQDLRAEIEKEKKLRVAAEDKIAILEAKTKNNKS